MKRIAFISGLVGPVLFVIVVTTLTILKYDFLLSLGWNPLYAPTLDWPSGLALGDYGWIMTLTFLLSGCMMFLFASGLRLSLFPSGLTRASTLTLSLAGIALAGLGFTTDRTIRSTSASWHGQLHDLSFVLLGFTLMLAMILLGIAFRKDDRWKNLSFYTWLTVALAFPTFWLKGKFFYVFLLSILFWSEIVAMRLNTISTN